jgi:hypothetical protein
MKKTILICICTLISVLLMQACNINVDSTVGHDDEYGNNQIYGSSNFVTISKDFRNYDLLELNNQVKATIIKGEEYSISIQVNDNLLSYLDTYQKGNKVVIGLKGNYNYRNVHFDVIIETPDINSLNLNGASAVDISGFNFTHKLSVISSGASSIKGKLNSGGLDLNLSGASVVNLQGSTKDLMILGSGACNINLLDFEVNYGDINLSGASSAVLYVLNKLDLSISGASVFKCKGNPTFGRLNISGGSVFQKIN